MNINELIRPGLAAMKGYAAIEPVEILEQRIGRRITKLDGNENPYGCSPKVYQSIADYPYYHIYPDPEQRMLRQALEEYAGLSCDYIICGNGSDELIDLILRLFLQPGDEVINCPPTFGMYPVSTDVCGGKVVDVSRDENFAVDMPGIKRALNEKTKVILIASPNNPTGNVIPEREVIELVGTGRIVVVDEAYFEFSNMTMAKLVLEHPNLIVLRTFSKWAGLAGLRIGYGIFPIEIAKYLMKIKQPYNVNAAAQAAVLASLADIDYLRSNVAKITAERERLFTKLGELEWLKPYPSQANFILCSLHCNSGSFSSHQSEPSPRCHSEERSDEESPAKETWQQLRKRGIFVRYYDGPGLENCLRISVGKPEDTDALINALKEVEHG
jgi:histidinol-phosphate aminotransferase